MSVDYSQYFSSEFDRKLREQIDDYDLRLELFKMLDDEMREFNSVFCDDCDYKRRCNQ